MNITKVEHPTFCRRCGRHIDDALGEQLAAMQPCDDCLCTFQEEIRQAIERRNHPTFRITDNHYKFTITESYHKFTIKNKEQ